ncbi:MAG: sugar ABC transporter permease [Blautia sp.]|nr:sugar ABC transporter permease [Blautia sp.]
MNIKGKNKIQAGVLLLPGLLIFGIFTLYPIVRLFWMSFFKWDFGSFLDQQFIGLENYRTVLADEYFRTAFVSTIVYALITVPAQMVLGLLIAMLINSITRFQIGFRVAYYLPVITSWVIASLIFKYVFNTEGLLNYFLTNVVHLTSPYFLLSERAKESSSGGFFCSAKMWTLNF